DAAGSTEVVDGIAIVGTITTESVDPASGAAPPEMIKLRSTRTCCVNRVPVTHVHDVVLLMNVFPVNSNVLTRSGMLTPVVLESNRLRAIVTSSPDALLTLTPVPQVRNEWAVIVARRLA